MALPTEDAKRKMVRCYQGCVSYFPDALAAVAFLSKVANEQHNPGEPMHWAKEKSTEELDSLMNHLLDVAAKGPESRDADGLLDAIKIAWRALANLQRLADSGVDLLTLEPAVPFKHEYFMMSDALRVPPVTPVEETPKRDPRDWKSFKPGDRVRRHKPSVACGRFGNKGDTGILMEIRTATVPPYDVVLDVSVDQPHGGSKVCKGCSTAAWELI